MEPIHYTVMGREVLTNLVPPHPSSLLVDATLGEGGHTDLFLSRYPDLQVIGLDADAGIIERAKIRLSRYGDRIQFVNTWFDEFFASPQGAARPSLILFDLGISSYHYRRSSRGFSFQSEEPLDMRLDTGMSLSAAEIVNGRSERELADLMFKYGEERYARRIASRIVRERESRRIETAADLAEIVARAVPADYRHGRIHPATRTFQALRIVVNSEIERIERALPAAVDMLEPGGRIGVISFHSLEDRVVKTHFRALARGERAGGYRADGNRAQGYPADGDRAGGYPAAGYPAEGSKTAQNQPTMKERGPVLTLVNRKPLRPQEDEVAENAASRSAKFRVAEKNRVIERDEQSGE